MTDQPWKDLPPPPGPSRIITPTDTITITIDNRGAAPVANMRVSRELPSPYVIGIMASLINQLSAEMMQHMMRAGSAALPRTEPGAEPRGNGGLGDKT